MTMQRIEEVQGFRAGDIVEVRSRDEILAMLDEQGRTENVPFMPEMLQYCGRRFRVSARADKTCDPAHIPWSLRRLKNAVHLEGVRCDGAAHGGCEAGCLMFWKEAWLKRATAPLTQLPVRTNGAQNKVASEPGTNGRPALYTIDSLLSATRARDAAPDEIRYSCQATELRTFTSPLPWWDVRQYFRDVSSGNLASGLAGNSLPERFLEMILSSIRVFQALLISVFNVVQRHRRGVPYPLVEGELAKTPIELLHLQPGEFVEVKSKAEIVATLDSRSCNRGLLFDAEMLRWCGGIYRVLRRVHNIIDEKSGQMLRMKHPCIILEGVSCQGDYHKYCPKAIYHYWRESWLRRANEIPRAENREQPGKEECESCVR